MSFSLEYFFANSRSHFENIVSPDGATYFDVLNGPTAEAVTDWPDFVDLPARYWEAAAFLDEVVDCDPAIPRRLRAALFSRQESDGLAYRPESSISRHDAELFDQSRLLYALSTWAMHTPEDEEVRSRLSRLCTGLLNKSQFESDYAYLDKIGVYFGGTLIRPLVQASMILNEDRFFDFASRLTRGLLHHSSHFNPEGEFEGHVHSNLGTLAGFIAVAIRSGDDKLLARARGIFDFARSISTEHGFVPEMARRQDDLVACETCAIMDYLDAALLLARHGDDSLWGIVEKTTRNHLSQSQIPDAPWLNFREEALDEDGILRAGLQRKLSGAFAGWSAPHALLAYEETLWPGWLKGEALWPRYLGKPRALQNCCAGAGVRALHQVWKNMVIRSGDTVSVNILISRETPDVKVLSRLPQEGLVEIEVLRDISLRVRIPDRSRNVVIRIAGTLVPVEERNGFVALGKVFAGAKVGMRFDLCDDSKTFEVGNPGFQKYAFTAHWYGESVTTISPDPGNPVSGHSHILNRHTPVFANEDAPGRMYSPFRTGNASHAPIRRDPSAIDWYSLHV